MKTKILKRRKVANRNIVFYMLLIMVSFSYAQVGIGNTDPQATLDIIASNQATPSNEDGILIPRVDAFPVTNPTVTQQGMLIYLTTDLTIATVVYPKGFYHWDLPNWVRLSSVEKLDDLIDAKTSNDGTSVFAGQFAGINDDGSDNRNTGLGYQVLQNVTTGNNNIAVGYRALQANLTGFGNVAMGNAALGGNTGTGAGLGNGNTAVGSNTMQNNTASQGAAFGYHALWKNTTGKRNTAIGWSALEFNLIGENNAAFGNGALLNSLSDNNSAFGYNALKDNLTGEDNVALGTNALSAMTASTDNVAVGRGAMSVSTPPAIEKTGNLNTVIGSVAGLDMEGNNNTLIGHHAGRTLIGDNNVMLGDEAGFTTTGSNNVFIGRQAGKHASFDTTSSTLVIQNTAASIPLIHGIFDDGTLTDKVGISKLATTYTLEVDGTTEANQFKVPALNTAPASNTAAGVTGEIRITATHIYVCTATNVWVRTVLSTW